MRREVEIDFSPQAKLLLKNLKNVKPEDVIDWFCKRKIFIGGGDIIDYLNER